MEAWLVAYVPAERDRLSRLRDEAWERHKEAETNGDDVAATVAAWDWEFYGDCLDSHAAFADWAKGWLTRRHLDRFDKMNFDF